MSIKIEMLLFIVPIDEEERELNIHDKLNGLMMAYHREARKCIRSKAYMAATVMHVAAFEAGLQLMCFSYPSQVKQTTVYAKKKFRGKRNRPLEFLLNQLINIAEELNWLPAKRIVWAGKRATIGGFSHEIRKVRNYVHPGEWARQICPLKFSKGVYSIVDEVIDVANSWLLSRIEMSISNSVNRKRQLKKGK